MDVFYALAEPTRRDIIELLATNGRLSAGSIAEKFKVSTSAISQHLRVLREVKLVRVEKLAQQRMYEVNLDTLSDLDKWVKQLTMAWEEQFKVLDKLLGEK